MAIQLRPHFFQSLKPYELQNPIPNHQSSFCWICLLLLKLSIIRSSCPPSHHWISLGFHFTGLNPEGRYPKHINWSLGFLRGQFLDNSSSPHTLHHWLPSYRHMASPSIALPAQPGKDWASCLPCNSNSTAWFHDSVRFINNYPISFGQKSWCNLWWTADLQRPHCKDCSILQVYQKYQAFSDRACCATSCPGPCHF